MKRDASCPLCGAKLTPQQVFDACEEIVGEGILACHCPYCQGYFEVRPGSDAIDIGYLRLGLFDGVLTLPAPGLAVLRDTETGTLRLRLAEQTWKFTE